MLRPRLTASLATLLLAFSGAAFADRHHDRERGSQRHGDRYSEQYSRHAGHQARYTAPPAHAVAHGYYQSRRGHGHDHHFHRGQRLPVAYRGQSYVVNDWRARHLHQPPRGHQWVQVGRDQMLVAIATGVIAQLIIGQ